MASESFVNGFVSDSCLLEPFFLEGREDMVS